MLNNFNRLKSAPGGRVSRPDSFIQARVLHGPTGRLETWREKDNPATWQHTIGQQNFYLILSLNSIISLQIIFLFLYQNS
jgi:hypothetical protein